MGLVYCFSCRKCNPSSKSNCQYCGAPLFGEVFDEDFSKDDNDSLDSSDDAITSGQIIKSHSFESAKYAIKKFSEETKTESDITRIESSKSVGEWFSDFFLGRGIGLDHVVKGGELNEIITRIQSNFVDINQTERKLIEEFGQVYNALEALDKDYIQDILISLKTAEKSAEDAKQAWQEALVASQKTDKTISDLSGTQKEIKKLVDNLSATVKVLSQLKFKLDKIQHLDEIDDIWSKCAETEGQLKRAELTISNLQNQIDELNILCNTQNNNKSKSPLVKRINLAYALSGASLCIALVELVLLFLR